MLFDKKLKKNKKKWGEDKVADVICQAVLHQNLCDDKHNPILVVDKATIKFLKRKYRLLTSYTVIYIISWASGYGLIKPHPMTPPILTPENAHEPDVYYIAPEFYTERIKPYLKEEPNVY